MPLSNIQIKTQAKQLDLWYFSLAVFLGTDNTGKLARFSPQSHVQKKNQSFVVIHGSFSLAEKKLISVMRGKGSCNSK